MEGRNAIFNYCRIFKKMERFTETSFSLLKNRKDLGGYDRVIAALNSVGGKVNWMVEYYGESFIFIWSKLYRKSLG